MAGNLTLDDVLMYMPKSRSLNRIIQHPDDISEKIRRCKIEILGASTLDKKIGILVDYINNKLAPEERCTFLALFKQSIMRDFILSGFGMLVGFILIKEGISLNKEHASKMFKLAAVSAGMASITFGGKVISDWLTLYNVASDFEKKQCTRRVR